MRSVHFALDRVQNRFCVRRADAAHETHRDNGRVALDLENPSITAREAEW